ncbi:MAG TPA: tryptophan synthase subunit alpha [Spirochaetales bacterium]|nr:tryptophan synthase subunit alpha [Spirochaetales bacterium]
MKRLMCHLVAGYPDLALSLRAAEGMVSGGATYLEVQFPFSDPTADGPTIQEACVKALEAGFTVEKGFQLVHTLTKQFPQVPLFIMSYASPVVRRGIEWFLDRAKDAGAIGLIVPDLPFDQDEGYFQAAWDRGLHPVAVVVPTMDPQRLDGLIAFLKSNNERYLYVALRTGITGNSTELSGINLSFLKELQEKGFKPLAGFGISSPEQVSFLSNFVDAAVVGSYLVGIIRDTAPKGAETLQEAVAKAVSWLVAS